MSLFERLGEKVESFKQEAEAARDEAAPYRCRECGERFYSEQETCPSCGSTELAVRADDRESDSESGTKSGIESETESGSNSTSGSEAEAKSESESTVERQHEESDQ
ncbi:zinc ribbon domain-containing protein [Natrialba sp. PRR66]|uniref:zinc ribbon domain-containing protein n=1 Tax=Natrialba sp. PRR66 TaxID=3098146 RepID=UPI002B1D8058|nr:zinc ribbon domain-containing protein [Natrialba sp. PRR66]